ncbi:MULTISPECIES: polysaccharide biosynthesis protein [Sphingobium]|uniref:Polysaccharide biosynthesis protein n=1 Tax=Sphingobium fuliginis (strain ATCC 27551) TaxID=336203 RepID=A0ABQ1EV77_SPHSA|nr:MULTISPECIES: polysaccharide biosynthesis protein [Sphingobium]AJR25604.1 polysaccharide biosynthesis protein [Sphingobium sp. YBL2]PNQ01399.1 polysaccharide biosynthesis protein [Sphingobium sp. SA916]RYL98903.1 polysaccharide biosynthesis protein [Sphingobium fuliginis]UXC92240.1 polysaccharide biosynthesis protein [Sphingobium sp. RSMS]WDA37712.1 polysaccharide biosynthesis protein [Sphingobium sp. YC-XJ3]
MAEAQVAENLPTGRVRRLGSLFGRFGLASLSSAIVSVSHLLVQLFSIHHLETAAIGTLAFLLVIIQFGYGLSNALVSTPYTIAVNQGDDADARSFDFFFPVNLMLAASQGLICAAIAWATASPAAALLFGMAGMLSLIRWFGRSNAYAHHAPARAARSDLAYAGTILAGLLIAMRTGADMPAIGGMLVAASLVGLLPFGLAYLRRHFAMAPARAMGAYRPVWKEQSAWTLVGVLSTEATSNSHSYIVTLLAGPTAFAPIAVGMLFFRPVNVCITALTQLERPRMTRAVARGDHDAAIRSERVFMAALVMLWLATCAVAAIALYAFPGLILKPTLDHRLVMVAVGLCALLSLVQCVQTPMSVMTQARKAFRPLAAQSMRSCGVGLVAVTLLVLGTAPVFSIGGVVLSQLVMMLGIWQLDRKWRRDQRGAA